MSPNSKAADLVVEVTDKHLILAEVKGLRIADAIEQLSETADAARKKYPAVDCKIFCKYPTPSDNEFLMTGRKPANGRWTRYRA
jgi:hypothetical protein